MLLNTHTLAPQATGAGDERRCLPMTNATFARSLHLSISMLRPSELAGGLGMGGFLARGKVALALNELVNTGRVEVIDASRGTPQLEKVNHIRYRLRE